jgi:transcription termination/antitermination protein NusG
VAEFGCESDWFRPEETDTRMGEAFFESHMNLEQIDIVDSAPPCALRPAHTPAWHVLWTRSRSEQLVQEQLAAKGFRLFLPMIDVWTRRNGIRQRSRVPMFPGYLFLHHMMDKQSYLAVIEARGLVRLLGEGWERLATLSDTEMEAIRRVEVSGLPMSHAPYLRAGQRVRITHGLLADIEGIFVRSKPNKGLFVIAIDLLQRSVAVEMDVTMVEAA